MIVSRTVVPVCVLIGLVAGTALAVNIGTVPVGNPGNAADSRYGGYGSVGYTYNIGKHEVTAGQYTAFLNKVAATDTYGLYNTSMWTASWGCKIQRSGSSGSYTYSVASDWANRPVNYVSWGDAARFANWLHNGQPTGAQGPGTTETGAYTLNGAMTNAELLAITRNADWKWAITSEDEWYKAAYHKNDGVTGNYWNYPTSSNTVPSNVLGNPIDPGNNGARNGDVASSGCPVRCGPAWNMPRTATAAPGRWALHVLNRAAARLPLFRKEEDCAALERVLLEARGRHLRGTA